MKKLLTSAALALTLTAAGMTSYAVNWVYLEEVAGLFRSGTGSGWRGRGVQLSF